ncbi:alpha/beta fold hydrolase [Parapusillimonas granuli]|uniref:Alpha/beta fold hydrolase n=1 Tax=Parapusillimonas granuli TaxID=380911 RepID=A0A853FZD1_9BURK|nr:alpha/beta fold hydrolase [Parapusillimonas granuli]MBB5216397.1 pyruvate dehydrogenase E2 component (dihydrolipoamide acetyltransferase) [Parapusillimonas granuli]NYT51464.1 alpha/beta fold hydrolase [Parapusillimonas granuli]
MDTVTGGVGLRTGPGPMEPVMGSHPLRYRHWAPQWPTRPTLVLIHGLFGDMESWPSLLPEALRLGFGVLCIELPSHGESPFEATGFDQAAARVAETLAQAANGPLVLVGHSMGAAIAARVARRVDAAQLRSLLLISPAGCGPDINQSFVDGMLAAADNRELEHEIGKLTVVPFGLDEAYLNAYRSRLAGQRAALARFCATVSVKGVQQVDIVPDLDALACPITLVHGREDRIIPWQHALNVPPQVALHLPQRVGHIPYEEAPGLVHGIIDRL